MAKQRTKRDIIKINNALRTVIGISSVLLFLGLLLLAAGAVLYQYKTFLIAFLSSGAGIVGLCVFFNQPFPFFIRKRIEKDILENGAEENAELTNVEIEFTYRSKKENEYRITLVTEDTKTEVFHFIISEKRPPLGQKWRVKYDKSSGYAMLLDFLDKDEAKK